MYYNKRIVCARASLKEATNKAEIRKFQAMLSLKKVVLIKKRVFYKNCRLMKNHCFKTKPFSELPQIKLACPLYRFTMCKLFQS